mmetsp:Transcript_100297/g.312510  ORF Transcript_100297/g.312510 Transcript_100297/m.312510 type:complete len:245 (-) Transcript_100297:718-1452(-)
MWKRSKVPRTACTNSSSATPAPPSKPSRRPPRAARSRQAPSASSAGMAWPRSLRRSPAPVTSSGSRRPRPSNACESEAARSPRGREPRRSREKTCRACSSISALRPSSCITNMVVEVVRKPGAAGVAPGSGWRPRLPAAFAKPPSLRPKAAFSISAVWRSNACGSPMSGSTGETLRAADGGDPSPHSLASMTSRRSAACSNAFDNTSDWKRPRSRLARKANSSSFRNPFVRRRRSTAKQGRHRS